MSKQAPKASQPVQDQRPQINEQQVVGEILIRQDFILTIVKSLFAEIRRRDQYIMELTKSVKPETKEQPNAGPSRTASKDR